MVGVAVQDVWAARGPAQGGIAQGVEWVEHLYGGVLCQHGEGCGAVGAVALLNAAAAGGAGVFDGLLAAQGRQFYALFRVEQSVWVVPNKDDVFAGCHQAGQGVVKCVAKHLGVA